MESRYAVVKKAAPGKGFGLGDRIPALYRREKRPEKASILVKDHPVVGGDGSPILFYDVATLTSHCPVVVRVTSKGATGIKNSHHHRSAKR